MRLVAALALLCALSGCGRTNPTPGKRVVVLGIDGMDPEFLERHWGSVKSSSFWMPLTIFSSL